MKCKNTSLRGILYFLLVCSLSNICFASLCERLKQVSGGEDHTLALMDDKTLWACGSNGWKQLGLGSGVTGSVYSLQQVLGEGGSGFLQDIATFDAGWKHSLAAEGVGDRTIWAWGSDGSGQLGNGAGGYSYVPQKVLGVGDPNYIDMGAFEYQGV